MSGVVFMIWMFWGHGKSAIFYLLANVILNSFLPFLGIIIPKLIIDEIIGLKRINIIISYAVVMLVGILLTSVLINWTRKKYFVKKIDISTKYEMLLYDNLARADLEQVESESFLDIKQKAWTFLAADGYGFGGVLDKAANIFTQVVVILGLVVIISTLNPIVVVVFIILTMINTYMSSRVKKINTKLNMERPIQERRLNYDTSLFEESKYAKEVRIYNLREWLLTRFQTRKDLIKGFYVKAYHNNMKAQIFGNLVDFFQQGVSYMYLIVKTVSGIISIGSFTMYINAIYTFSHAMNSIMDNFIDMLRFNDYYSAVQKYMNIPHRQRSGEHHPLVLTSPPAIEFKNVSFKYPGQDRYALISVNVKINPGERILIIGENGAGKTTFVKLLLRLYEPSQGNILLDGNDVYDYDYDDYAKCFSAVFQDYCLFSTSIKENVMLSNSASDNQEDVSKVLEALKMAGLETLLHKLEKGINTSVYKNFDDTGFEPSGGEGQKIALARALYKNAPVVILDEPTAALDPRAEHEIYEGFNRLIGNKTAIYISHRLASARFCDKIIVLVHGEIKEIGSHEELLQKRGVYHELFNMQADFYVDKK